MGPLGPFLDDIPTIPPNPPSETASAPPAPISETSDEFTQKILTINDWCGDTADSNYRRYCAVIQGYAQSVNDGIHPPVTEELREAVSFLEQPAPSMPPSTIVISEFDFLLGQSDANIGDLQAAIFRDCLPVFPEKIGRCLELNYSLGQALMERGRLEKRFGHPEEAEVIFRSIMNNPAVRIEVPAIAAQAAYDLASLYDEEAKASLMHDDVDRAEILSFKMLEIHAVYPMTEAVVGASFNLATASLMRYAMILGEAMNAAPLSEADRQELQNNLDIYSSQITLYLFNAFSADSELSRPGFDAMHGSVDSLVKAVDEYFVAVPDRRARDFRFARRQIGALHRLVKNLDRV